MNSSLDNVEPKYRKYVKGLIVKDNNEITLHLSKTDMRAVANNRYMRKTGRMLLMILLITILVVSEVCIYVPQIPKIVAYPLLGVIALLFFYLYNKGETKVRNIMFKMMQENGYMVADDED